MPCRYQSMPAHCSRSHPPHSAHTESRCGLVFTRPPCCCPAPTQVVFLYKLQQGRVSSSFGLYCARASGVEPPLLARAAQLLGHMVSKGTGAGLLLLRMETGGWLLPRRGLPWGPQASQGGSWLTDVNPRSATGARRVRGAQLGAHGPGGKGKGDAGGGGAADSGRLPDGGRRGAPREHRAVTGLRWRPTVDHPRASGSLSHSVIYLHTLESLDNHIGRRIYRQGRLKRKRFAGSIGEGSIVEMPPFAGMSTRRTDSVPNLRLQALHGTTGSPMRSGSPRPYARVSFHAEVVAQDNEDTQAEEMRRRVPDAKGGFQACGILCPHVRKSVLLRDSAPSTRSLMIFTSNSTRIPCVFWCEPHIGAVPSFPFCITGNWPGSARSSPQSSGTQRVVSRSWMESSRRRSRRMCSRQAA